jgi:hypothetical protein
MIFHEKKYKGVRKYVGSSPLHILGSEHPEGSQQTDLRLVGLLNSRVTKRRGQPKGRHKLRRFKAFVEEDVPVITSTDMPLPGRSIITFRRFVTLDEIRCSSARRVRNHG